jgi:hypothetical protein
VSGQVTNRRDPDVWQAQSLRLTAFHTQGNGIIQQSWWQELVGEAAETITDQPKKGMRQEEGPFESGVLSLRIEPSRIDWLFFARGEQSENPNQFPTIGSFSDAEKPFRSLAEKWLRVCPLPSRLAFGAILVLPAPNHEAGYRLLGSYLPAVNVDPDSSDFTYSVNRRRQSKIVADLKINRLSRWAFLRSEVVRLLIDSGGPVLAKRSVPQKDYACTLELDVNTAPEFSASLPKEKLLQLFDELLGLAEEIASKGDVK